MRKIKLFIYSCLLGISALPVQAKVITQSQAQALAAKYVSVGNGSKQQTFSLQLESQVSKMPLASMLSTTARARDSCSLLEMIA